MCLIFVGQGYPRKLFNLEHFPIYGICLIPVTITIHSRKCAVKYSGYVAAGD